MKSDQQAEWNQNLGGIKIWIEWNQKLVGMELKFKQNQSLDRMELFKRLYGFKIQMNWKQITNGIESGMESKLARNNEIVSGMESKSGWYAIVELQGVEQNLDV